MLRTAKRLQVVNKGPKDYPTLIKSHVQTTTCQLSLLKTILCMLINIRLIFFRAMVFHLLSGMSVWQTVGWGLFLMGWSLQNVKCCFRLSC